MNQSEQSNNNINYLGKLPNSSYYDKPNKIIEPKSSAFIDAPSTITKHPAVPPNDTNLFVKSCVFSPDNTHLAWTCGFKIVKIMKFKKSNKTLRTFASIENEIEDTGFNNFNENDVAEIDCSEIVKSLAFGSSNIQDSTRRVHYRDRKLASTRFNFGDNNLLLAVGLITGKIRLYDAKNHSLIMHLFSHSDVVNDLKFTIDGSLQLMSASSDETVKFWNIYQDGNMYKTLKGHINKVNMCDWSPVSKLVCSVGQNRQAFIWETENYKLKHSLKGHLHNVSSCKFSPDGALVATASYDTKLCLWNPYTGELVKQFCHMLPPPRLIYASGDNGAYVRSFAFSKEGTHLISICDDKKIRVWSLASRSMIPVAEGAMNSLGQSCSYSSTHKTIMVGTKTGHLDKYVYNNPTAPRLVDLCRRVVNLKINRPASELHLPKELISFLSYNDISDEPKKSINSLNQIPVTTIASSNLLMRGTALCS